MITRVIIIKYIFLLLFVETEIMNLPLIWSNKTKYIFFILLVETETMGVVGNNMGLGNMLRLATVEKEKEKKEEEAMSSSQVFNAWVQLLRSHMTWFNPTFHF